MKVDVTITATRRPEVLYETLYSFHYNLLGVHNCRAIINIDPVGWGDSDLCVLAVQEFFIDYVINEPSEANFSKAFKWCWSQVEAPWVFHLEDDWRLEKQVNLEHMAQILNKHDNLVYLRLPQFGAKGTQMRCWNLWFPFTGDYFECPKKLKIGGGFCGHPALIKGDFVKRCAELLDENLNPEKQFHTSNRPLVKEHMKYDYGVYGKPDDTHYITDLGRAWMVENKFRKKGNKANFTEWERS